MAEAKKPELVKCRVTKKGDGKISTGEHVVCEGDKVYALNDKFEAAADIATALEARDFVEILP